MNEGTQQYEHLESLLTYYPSAVLRIWFSQRDCYEGEVNLDDVDLIGAYFDYNFETIDELLEELNSQSNTHLDEYGYEGESAHLAQFEGLDSPEGMRYLEGRESERDYEEPPF